MGKKSPETEADVRRLGRWVYDTRSWLSLSQDSLARACGVSQAAISRIEYGADIRLRTAVAIYRFLRARQAEVLGQDIGPGPLGDFFEPPDAIVQDDRRRELLREFDACTEWQRRLLWATIQPIFRFLRELREHKSRDVALMRPRSGADSLL